MKSLFALSLLLASTSAFAMGFDDTSAIQPKLEEAKNAGFQCKEVWPENFYLSQVEPSGTFTVGIVCAKGGVEKKGTITYIADDAQFARCRDTRALSIELDLK